ncbi:hypothetical protein LTR81_027041, partial [Elasticomyces elasticus]
RRGEDVAWMLRLAARQSLRRPEQLPLRTIHNQFIPIALFLDEGVRLHVAGPDAIAYVAIQGR